MTHVSDLYYTSPVTLKESVVQQLHHDRCTHVRTHTLESRLESMAVNLANKHAHILNWQKAIVTHTYTTTSLYTAIIKATLSCCIHETMYTVHVCMVLVYNSPPPQPSLIPSLSVNSPRLHSMPSHCRHWSAARHTGSLTPDHCTTKHTGARSYLEKT